MADNTIAENGHPRGLYVLFFTELWERFGFYLMVGIFMLYLIDPASNGGKGMSIARAADMVGSYIALVFFTPFIGGLLADRVLGYRKAIILGGILLALGYYGLALGGNTSMYISLLLIIVGNGFFKPNISTLLGNLYNKEGLRSKKDTAYNIFYMGTNIGAFVCNFVAAYMRNHFGWGYAFATAGVGMTLGVLWFILGMKHVKEGDAIRPVQKEDMPLKKIGAYVFLPAMLAAGAGWFYTDIFGYALFGTRSNDAFMFACIPVIIFYILLYVRSSKKDKRGLGALFSFFIVTLVFWVVFNQNSTALTVWADQYTNREMPVSIEKAVRPFGMLQTVSAVPHEVPKVDQYLRVQVDAHGREMQTMGTDPYFQNLPKEKWPHNGELKLLSPEIFQSIDPLFIILLTPLLVGLFSWLARRKKEPATPVKVSLGVFIAGLSSLLMIIAISTTDIYHNKVGMLWLFSTYVMVTIGELLVSPIGLSMVSKLSPVRLTALMMGAWFLENSIAGKLAGLMTSFWGSFIDKRNYFLILVIAACIAALATFIISKPLSGVIRERTGSN
ncbi:MAG: MFS transporter [Chitinophagaceae bacterium]|nr:MAG: MFS transporter [Chitinophagaceae bacterium]